ncbi:DNA-binding beta-propeller fold protein YncE [Lampropedia hyalina DSM 16112]|jgi:DNA-binding beta-propeller fold protein YncE|uniref:DNA-binding beta-propeller fold protein YncE n=1 Tax=Lampropedia hyalina DSM 16112 TaxID=1122156 RepID=A0A1M4YR64_9BURK|nr:YncE family protein [Lampropedia hyalina]SHF08284.1 DNA-binding beta-propeller fold protein YncE [Lampropedia hyalina DSM 16112]
MRKTSPLSLMLLAAALTCGTVLASTEAVSAPPDAVVESTTVQIQRAEFDSSIYELAYSEKQQAVFAAAPVWDDEKKSKVLRLHPETLAVQAEIELPLKGFGVALDETNDRLYVGHGFDGAVSVVDIAANKLIHTIQLAQKIKGEDGKDRYSHHLRELVIDARHKRLYVPGFAAKNSVLYVIDTESLKPEKTIPGFGFHAIGIALNAKENRVYVSNQQGQVMEVDAATLELVKTHEVEADQLLNLVFDPASGRLLGTDQGYNRNELRNKSLGHPYTPRSNGHKVVVLDPSTGKINADPDTDKYPVALLLDGERQRFYVTNFNGIGVEEGRGTLMVFESDSYKLLQTIALPPHPSNLALDTKRNVLYVSVKRDRSGWKNKTPESVVRIQF